MKITDIKQRAIKTFVQTFLGILIPEICVFLQNATVSALTWSSLWYLGVPVICSALASAISAVWNLVNNWLIKEDEKNYPMQPWNGDNK